MAGENDYASRFLAGPTGEACRNIDRAELERALVALVDRAQRAWPDLDVAAGDFIAYVAARCPLDDGVIAALDALRSEDLYLALACRRGIAGAVDALHRGHLADMSSAVIQQYGSSALADDVRQIVAESLLVGAPDRAPRIEQYAGRGALRSWLRVIGLREALRLAKTRDVGSGDDALLDRALGGEDDELVGLKSAYRKLFRQAFDEAVAALSIHDRLLLRQHFLDGLSLDEMARLHRVHRATAARHLAAIRNKLLAHTRKRFRAELSIDADEFDELIAMISSRLDASISRLLQ